MDGWLVPWLMVLEERHTTAWHRSGAPSLMVMVKKLELKLELEVPWWGT